jgi:bis(5'-adenosyl)-triphosphatase
MRCVFCDYPSIADEIFAESTYFYAIYNLYPILPGHVLIIPKAHKQYVVDLSEEELEELMPFSRKVAKVIFDVFEAESFD